MKQIFIVTSGEYSDYSIIACFSTEKKAKDFMKYFSGLSKWNSPRVEVYGLDLSVIEQAEKGYTVYRIVMLRDGSIESIKDEGPDYLYRGSHYYVWFRQAHRHNSPPDAIVVDACAKTREQAIKIANDFRAQSIAQNEWTETEDEDV